MHCDHVIEQLNPARAVALARGDSNLLAQHCAAELDELEQVTGRAVHHTPCQCISSSRIAAPAKIPKFEFLNDR